MSNSKPNPESHIRPLLILFVIAGLISIFAQFTYNPHDNFEDYSPAKPYVAKPDTVWPDPIRIVPVKAHKYKPTKASKTEDLIEEKAQEAVDEILPY